MTDPTPTRAEVEALIVGIDRGERDETAMSIGQKNHDGTFTVLSILHGTDAEAVAQIVAENQALREQAEAAEAERDRQYDENVNRIAMQARAENERDALRERAEAAERTIERLDKALSDGMQSSITSAERYVGMMDDLTAAHRGEAAAWNDAIEAAAAVAEEWDTFGPTVRAIRALRRAAPAEGEA